jgi:acetyl-CoA carboxylase alpha subunit
LLLGLTAPDRQPREIQPLVQELNAPSPERRQSLTARQCVQMARRPDRLAAAELFVSFGVRRPHGNIPTSIAIFD